MSNIVKAGVSRDAESRIHTENKLGREQEVYNNLCLACACLCPWWVQVMCDWAVTHPQQCYRPGIIKLLPANYCRAAFGSASSRRPLSPSCHVLLAVFQQHAGKISLQSSKSCAGVSVRHFPTQGGLFLALLLVPGVLRAVLRDLEFQEKGNAFGIPGISFSPYRKKYSSHLPKTQRLAAEDQSGSH